MYMHPVEENKTRVQFDLKIDVRFILYPAFRIIPEKILHAMTNAGMSMIMQTSTNKMFHSITKDFDNVELCIRGRSDLMDFYDLVTRRSNIRICSR